MSPMTVAAKVRCSFDRMVDANSLKPHPKNPNHHSPEQIERLAKILLYQGFRSPIIVSKRSGFIVAGHGRLEAARLIGWSEVPVNEQDFETEEHEYAHLVADNAIAEWAELDLSGINADLGDLGPDFDIDLLGIKNFEIEIADKLQTYDEDEVPKASKEPTEPRDKTKQCPNCGELI